MLAEYVNVEPHFTELVPENTLQYMHYNYEINYFVRPLLATMGTETATLVANSAHVWSEFWIQHQIHNVDVRNISINLLFGSRPSLQGNVCPAKMIPLNYDSNLDEGTGTNPIYPDVPQPTKIMSSFHAQFLYKQSKTIKANQTQANLVLSIITLLAAKLAFLLKNKVIDKAKKALMSATDGPIPSYPNNPRGHPAFVMHSIFKKNNFNLSLTTMKSHETIFILSGLNKTTWALEPLSILTLSWTHN